MFRTHRVASKYSSKKPPLLVVPGMLLFAFLVFLTSFSNAQQLTGTISGTTYDQSGAIIPKAQVLLKNEANGTTRNTISDAEGYFSVTALQPAAYTVTVSADGFTSWRESGIVVTQGSSLTVPNIKLKVGGSTTEVDVISGVDAVVPMDTSEVSTTLNQQMINDIAISGRDAGELLKIMPGMALNNGGTQGSSFNGTGAVGSNTGPVGAYSANGTQPNGTMAFMLDGANLVDPGNFGTQIANINQDMVSEIKVLMSSYTPEYAKGPVVFQAFSKSGGQHFHGEGYFYARNSEFNSWNAYSKSIYTDALKHPEPGVDPSALPNTLHPNESYYYMGGNVGGPVILPHVPFNKNRDKLFFWVGYEYMKQQPAATPINYNVPTANQLAGNFDPAGLSNDLVNSSNAYAYYNANNHLPANATTNHIPVSDFDPNIMAMVAAGYYPAPNVTPNKGNGYNNYTYVSSIPQNRWEAVGKIDYAISENTKLTASYTRQVETDQHPVSIWWAAPWTLPYPSPVVAPTTSNLIMTNLTHVFNATTTNEFVFTLARYINPSSLANPAAVDRNKIGFNVNGLFGHTTAQIPNIEGPWGGAMPNISEESFDQGWNNNAFGGLKYAPAFYDNFSKVVRTHSFKGGFYWDNQGDVQTNSGADNGTYNLGWGANGTGNLIADMLLGRIGNYQQQSSVPVYDIHFHQWSLYGQDSWKANSQLTINYGLRLDHIGQWYGGTVGGGNNLGFQVWDQASYVDGPGTAAPPNTGIKWNAIDKSVPVSGFTSRLFYFAPRIGLAYDVFGTGKTVFRAGLALFPYNVTSEVGNAWNGPQGSFVYQVNNADGPFDNTTGTSAGYKGIEGFSAPSSTTQNGSTVYAMQKGDSRTPMTTDWNATVSQALPWRSVFEVSYVGNKSANEYIDGSNGKIYDLNNIAPGAQFLPDPYVGSNNNGKTMSPAPPSCSTTSLSLYCYNNPTAYNISNYNTNDFRPMQAYQDVYLLTHGSYSNYNSLQVNWQKQSGRINFVINYTFSKVLGVRDGGSNNGNGNGTAVNPFSLAANYGPLAYDHTNIFNASYVWNLPKPIHGNRLLEGAVNGWQISGYTAYQSGAPLQTSTGGSLNAQYPGNLTVPTVSNPDLPDNSITLPNGLKAIAVSPQTWFGSNSINLLLPVLTCDPRKNRASGQYFNPKCFAPPAYGEQGTTIWPYLRNPAYFDTDLALYKNFQITENQKIQFRVSATNFLNHPLKQFGLSGTSDEQLSFTGTDSSGNQYLSQTNMNADTDGKPTNKTGNRSILFALKYYF